jgi:hypothetical protein
MNKGCNYCNHDQDTLTQINASLFECPMCGGFWRRGIFIDTSPEYVPPDPKAGKITWTWLGINPQIKKEEWIPKNKTEISTIKFVNGTTWKICPGSSFSNPIKT